MKGISKYILSFIIFISLILLTFLLILMFTVLNKEYMLKRIEKNNYYEEAYNSIINNFENNLIQSGVSIDTAKKIVTKDMVEKDIKKIINSIYDNEELTLSSEEIRLELDKIIYEILDSNNRMPDAEEIEDIKSLENAIASIYTEEIAYSINSVNILRKAINTINSFIYLILVVLVVLTIILLLILLSLKGLDKFCISLYATGISLIVIKFLVGNSYKNILLFNKFLSNTLIDIISNILKMVLNFGIFYVCLGLLITIIIVVKKQKNN